MHFQCRSIAARLLTSACQFQRKYAGADCGCEVLRLFKALPEERSVLLVAVWKDLGITSGLPTNPFGRAIGEGNSNRRSLRCAMLRVGMTECMGGLRAGSPLARKLHGG